MKIVSTKTMFLLEKGMDFTDDDLVKSDMFGRRLFLSQEYKDRFIINHGFTNATQQFPICLLDDGKEYCQIEFERKESIW